MRLVRAELPLLDAALVSDDALALALGCAVVPGWATFVAPLEPIRDDLVGNPYGAAWGPRFFLSDDPPRLVGWGRFKGPPHRGAVELGYGIAPSCRRRGYASAAVRAMVDEALAAEEVTTVFANTPACHNASNRLLERLGFRFDDEVRRGNRTIWRFVLRRPRSLTKV